MTLQKIWLVDSNIYIFRSWFKLPKSLKDKDNRSINAVHGFIDFVYQLLTQEQPMQIGFAFDQTLKESHRRAIYPEYKAHRKSAPDDLRYQFRLCRSFLRLMGLAEFSSGYYEADDLIGTLAQHYRSQNKQIILITADKDLTQLIHEGDIWWEYNQNKKLDYRAIKKRFKVWPNQIADLLAIAGDKADNIPGVPEIGMPTAAQLLNRFGTLENLIASIPEIGKTKMRRAKYLQNLIAAHVEQMRLSHRLTKIVCDIHDAPLEQSLQRCTQHTQQEYQRLWEFFEQINYPLTENERQQWIKLITC